MARIMPTYPVADLHGCIQHKHRIHVYVTKKNRAANADVASVQDAAGDSLQVVFSGLDGDSKYQNLQEGVTSNVESSNGDS